MAKIEWRFVNENGTNLNRYIATNVATGEEITFDLLRGGNINVIGTPLNAENLNKLIESINAAYDQITSNEKDTTYTLSRDGDTVKLIDSDGKENTFSLSDKLNKNHGATNKNKIAMTNDSGEIIFVDKLPSNNLPETGISVDNAKNIITTSDEKISGDAIKENINVVGDQQKKIEEIDDKIEEIDSKIEEIVEDSINSEVIKLENEERETITGKDLSITDQQMLITKVEGRSAFDEATGKIIHSENTLVSIGRNIWDEQWEIGWIDGNGNNYDSNVNFRSKNYISCFPNTKYYVKTDSTSIAFRFYDNEKKLVSISGVIANQELITPTNAYFMRFFSSPDGKSIYNYDICINVYDESFNGTYEPYKEQRIKLPLLRYLDTYEPYAGVIRENSLVTGLGELDWTVSLVEDYYIFKSSTISNWIKKVSSNSEVANIWCPEYNVDSYVNVYGNGTEKSISVNVNGEIVICDNRFTNSSDFKEYLLNNDIPAIFENLNTVLTNVEFPQNNIAVYKNGMLIQEGTIPYKISSELYLNLKGQIVVNVEVDRNQEKKISVLKEAVEEVNKVANTNLASINSINTNISNIVKRFEPNLWNGATQTNHQNLKETGVYKISVNDSDKPSGITSDYYVLFIYDSDLRKVWFAFNRENNRVWLKTSLTNKWKLISRPDVEEITPTVDGLIAYYGLDSKADNHNMLYVYIDSIETEESGSYADLGAFTIPNVVGCMQRYYFTLPDLQGEIVYIDFIVETNREVNSLKIAGDNIGDNILTMSLTIKGI